VGIISKEEHCRGLLDRIKAEPGFRAHLLGGNVTSIPSSIDVAVCRTKSCSHTSTNTALAENRREGGRTVIFENGVDRALQALVAFKAGTYDPSAPEAAPSNQSAIEPASAPRIPLRKAITEVIEAGGFFFTRMRTRMDEPTAGALLQCMGFVTDESRLRLALATVHLAKESSIPSTVTYIRRNMGFRENTLWQVRTKGVRSFFFLSREKMSAEQLDQLATLTGSFTTKRKALKGRAQMKEADIDPETLDPTRIVTAISKVRELAAAKQNEVAAANLAALCEGTGLRAYYDPEDEVRDGKGWNLVEEGEDGGIAARFVSYEKAEEWMKAQIEAEAEAKAADEAKVDALETDLINRLPATSVIEAKKPEGKQAEDGTPIGRVQAPPDANPNQDEKDLADLFQMLKDQMGKMGMKTFESHGVRAEVLTIHVAGPDGVSCGKSGIDPSQVSTKLSDCTCSLCKNTTFFKAASWAFANIQA
jgi:hypothetical protein